MARAVGVLTGFAETMTQPLRYYVAQFNTLPWGWTQLGREQSPMSDRELLFAPEKHLSGDRWEIALPAACIVCGRPCSEPEQTVERIVPDPFGVYRAALYGAAVGLVLWWLARWWFLPLSVLAGVWIGYFRRVEQRVAVRFRRCSNHAGDATYPEMLLISATATSGLMDAMRPLLGTAGARRMLALRAGHARFKTFYEEQTEPDAERRARGEKTAAGPAMADEPILSTAVDGLISPHRESPPAKARRCETCGRKLLPKESQCPYCLKSSDGLAVLAGLCSKTPEEAVAAAVRSSAEIYELAISPSDGAGRASGGDASNVESATDARREKTDALPKTAEQSTMPMAIGAQVSPHRSSPPAKARRCDVCGRKLLPKESQCPYCLKSSHQGLEDQGNLSRASVKREYESDVLAAGARTNLLPPATWGEILGAALSREAMRQAALITRNTFLMPAFFAILLTFGAHDPRAVIEVFVGTFAVVWLPSVGYCARRCRGMVSYGAYGTVLESSQWDDRLIPSGAVFLRILRSRRTARQPSDGLIRSAAVFLLNWLIACSPLVALLTLWTAVRISHPPRVIYVLFSLTFLLSLSWAGYYLPMAETVYALKRSVNPLTVARWLGKCWPYMLAAFILPPLVSVGLALMVLAFLYLMPALTLQDWAWLAHNLNSDFAPLLLQIMVLALGCVVWALHSTNLSYYLAMGRIVRRRQRALGLTQETEEQWQGPSQHKAPATRCPCAQDTPPQPGKMPPKALGDGAHCRACGQAMRPGAAICIECGFDLRTGKKLQREAVLPTCEECGANLAQREIEVAGGHAICASCRAKAIESSVPDNDVSRMVSWMPGGPMAHTVCGLLSIAVGIGVVILVGLFYPNEGDPFFAALFLLSPFVTGIALLLLAAEERRARVVATRAGNKGDFAKRRGVPPDPFDGGAKDPEDLYKRGVELFGQDKFRDAAAVLEATASLNPSSAPVHFTLGATYSRIAGEHGNDEEKARPWMKKSRDCFNKAVDLARTSGGLNEKQLSIARDVVTAFDRITERNSPSLPEESRKRVFADFMETRDTELLLGTNIAQEFNTASRNPTGGLAAMMQSLNRTSAQAEGATYAKIGKKYRLNEGQLRAIVDEGEQKKWSFRGVVR